MAGLAKAQMAGAAFGFQALQSKFLALLEALKEKLPEQPEAQPTGAPEAPRAEAGLADEPMPEEQQEQPTQDPPEGGRAVSRPDTQETPPEEGGEGKE